MYDGSDVTAVADARPQPASNGNGFDLNFESTPVATVAKVVLGDILHVGYTIDPRVQGTVSLVSVRPVPKSDMVFVLENALRLSGVVLMKDTAGYRLTPLGDAVGGGRVDGGGQVRVRGGQAGDGGQQRGRDAEALSHTQGEAADPFAGHIRQAHQREHLVYPRPGDPSSLRLPEQGRAGGAVGVDPFGVEKRAHFARGIVQGAVGHAVDERGAGGRFV